MTTGDGAGPGYAGRRMRRPAAPRPPRCPAPPSPAVPRFVTTPRPPNLTSRFGASAPDGRDGHVVGSWGAMRVHGRLRGKRPGTPFGPEPVSSAASSGTVVYWMPGPFPGPTPRPIGIPGPALRPALRLVPAVEVRRYPHSGAAPGGTRPTGRSGVQCWTGRQPTGIHVDVNRRNCRGSRAFRQVTSMIESEEFGRADRPGRWPIVARIKVRKALPRPAISGGPGRTRRSPPPGRRHPSPHPSRRPRTPRPYGTARRAPG